MSCSTAPSISFEQHIVHDPIRQPKDTTAPLASAAMRRTSSSRQANVSGAWCRWSRLRPRHEHLEPGAILLSVDVLDDVGLLLEGAARVHAELAHPEELDPRARALRPPQELVEVGEDLVLGDGEARRDLGQEIAGAHRLQDVVAHAVAVGEVEDRE